MKPANSFQKDFYHLDNPSALLKSLIYGLLGGRSQIMSSEEGGGGGGAPKCFFDYTVMNKKKYILMFFMSFNIYELF